MIDRASDLPPAPEPIGTAAEWEARLEEWHDADQRAERDTVTSSRGLTYAVLHDAHCGYDDGGRPVIERRAVTPAYNDHDTVAATAAGA